MSELMVVVGTRPNFMKVTRFREVAAARGGPHIRLVHTGQHADTNMSSVFFEQFGMWPDHWLGVSQGRPVQRIARIMMGLGDVIDTHAPDAVVVGGDVDSTLAAALSVTKREIPLIHLESGLRSFDRTMPEEVNRVIIDRLSDLHFVTEPSGRRNLLNEGADPAGIHFVGNTMIDTLVACEERIQADPILDHMDLGVGGHVLMTMHRPSNVDDAQGRYRLIELLASVASGHTVVFPMHPRTGTALRLSGGLGELQAIAGLRICPPLPYLAFQRLLATSACVITDSGGVQEETTYRGVPCLTLRPGTERPVTVEEGTNSIVAPTAEAVAHAMAGIRKGGPRGARIPELWDGHATERIFDVLERVL